MKTRFITAAFLLAGLAVSARAQWAGNESDLILGVQDLTGAGNTGHVDLLVDLGNAQNTYVTGSNTPLAPGTTYTWNLATDLTDAFGSDWKTSGNVLFSILGGSQTGDTNAAGTVNEQSPNGTLFAMSPNSTVLVPSNQTNQVNLINNKLDLYNTGWAGTALNTPNGLTVGNTGATSYSVAISANNSPNSFGYGLWGVSNIQADAASGASHTLYELTPGSPGAAIALGTFTLDSTGLLTFSSGLSAIPEPSTYAMILGAAALGFVMIRRRKQALA